jgi:hypothetical protein
MNNTDPKEKALELCQSFGRTTLFSECNEGYTLPLEIAKQCALIAIDEVIFEIGDFDNTDGYAQSRINYWEEVKQEIEKL